MPRQSRIDTPGALHHIICRGIERTASHLVALGYFGYKLVFWDNFQVGMAPLVISLFFFSSVQLFFIGIIGEYIGAIHTQVLKRPAGH